jgi:DNA-binding response OmpR family regulator
MKKKILLVDDSKMILMMEKMILGQGAYELLVAHDGREAVEKALAEKPDLILLDVMMPAMNGFEALKRLREEAATRSIPVIMVTTRGEAENVAEGQASGCDAYLTKPIDNHELLAKVRSLLKT